MSFAALFESVLTAWSCGFFSSLLVVYVFLFFHYSREVARSAAYDIRGS